MLFFKNIGNEKNIFHRVNLWEQKCATYTKEPFPLGRKGGWFNFKKTKKQKNLQVNYWFTCMFQKEILPGPAGYVSILKSKPNYLNIKTCYQET